MTRSASLRLVASVLLLGVLVVGVVVSAPVEARLDCHDHGSDQVPGVVRKEMPPESLVLIERERHLLSLFRGQHLPAREHSARHLGMAVWLAIPKRTVSRYSYAIAAEHLGLARRRGSCCRGLIVAAARPPRRASSSGASPTGATSVAGRGVIARHIAHLIQKPAPPRPIALTPFPNPRQILSCRLWSHRVAHVLRPFMGNPISWRDILPLGNA